MVSKIVTFANNAVTSITGAGGSTSYVLETATHSSSDQPQVTLGTTSSSVTDSSGFVDYVLASVDPIHAAVLASTRNNINFNVGTVSTYSGTATINEASQPWARSDTITDFLSNIASGSNGFSTVGDITTVVAGDIISYQTGIYTNPGSTNASTDPTLLATAETGHSMIVVGAPSTVAHAN